MHLPQPSDISSTEKEMPAHALIYHPLHQNMTNFPEQVSMSADNFDPHPEKKELML